MTCFLVKGKYYSFQETEMVNNLLLTNDIFTQEFLRKHLKSTDDIIFQRVPIRNDIQDAGYSIDTEADESRKRLHPRVELLDWASAASTSDSETEKNGGGPPSKRKRLPEPTLITRPEIVSSSDSSESLSEHNAENDGGGGGQQPKSQAINGFRKKIRRPKDTYREYLRQRMELYETKHRQRNEYLEKKIKLEEEQNVLLREMIELIKNKQEELK